MQHGAGRRLSLEPCELRTMLSAAPAQAVDADPLWEESLAQIIEETADLDNYSEDQLADTQQWVVGLSDASEPEAMAIALGGQVIDSASSLGNCSVWEFPADEEWQAIADALDLADEVDFYYPLVANQQEVRSLTNDPLLSQEWHLVNSVVAGEDINVASVWDTYQGDGVVIGMVDDGLDTTHADLAAHYRADLSYDFNFTDANPQHDQAGEGHGTAAAGVAAAVGNNATGVAGVAYDAGLAAIRLVSAATTDAQEAEAITYQYDDIDIYNNSWGPADASGALTRPGPLLTAALRDGVTNGRGGLGSIYTWAAGNGGALGDNVNYDGYANSRYTIAVGALDQNGERASYSESGAALLVSAYAGEIGEGLTTTDRTGSAGYSTTGYSSTFNGTSAAAPVVSGVVALMLQANPNLTYRDVQHILVQTARQNDAADADWTTNGAGLHVNHQYGFGAVDAAAAVALAENWTTVGEEVALTSGVIAVNEAIPDNNTQGISSTVALSGEVTDIEWVEVVFDADHSFWGDLEVVLVSPDGTRSVLAEQHNTADAGGFDSWTFTTSRCWGESAEGEWTLQVRDRSGGDVGTWNWWEVRAYGTDETIDLDTVDFAELAGIDLSGGDAWYALDAAREGTLTVVADASSPALSLALFDADYGLLADSSTPAGSPRIDVEVAAGDAFWLRLSGSADEVALSLANLLTIRGTTVSVFGTAAADDFECTPSGDACAIWINGIDYTLKASRVQSVAFDGGAGADQATLTGLETADNLTLAPGWAELAGEGLQITVASADDIAVSGGGGADVAALKDSSGDDTLSASPGDVWFFRGGVFSNRALDFTTVGVVSSAGGTDEAYLYDAETGDLFTATPDVARMIAGDTLHRALAFERVYGIFEEGGTDVARLYDSEGDDTLAAGPDLATLAGTGFFLQTEGYTELYAVADGGGTDSAALTGSDGADSFYALPGDARLSADGRFLRAREFDTVSADAAGGDGDVVTLVGSSGADAYMGLSTWAALTGPGYVSDATGFDVVYAVGRGGLADTAELYGSPEVDTYTAKANYGRLANSTFLQRAAQFETLTVYGGDEDVARLYDSVYDDALTAAPNEALFQAGRLHHGMLAFRYVHAVATSGGRDTAILTGSNVADTLVASAQQARLYNDQFYVRAAGFDAVYADGGLGDDSAALLDSSGADTLLATADRVSLTDSALAYLVEIGGFEHIRATSVFEDDGDTALAALGLPYELALDGIWEG